MLRSELVASNGPFDRVAYRRHLAEQSRLRIAWIAILGGVFYPAFAALDWIDYRADFTTFLVVRGGVTAAILTFAGIGWRRPTGRWAQLVVIVCCVFAQLGVLFMIFMGGGFASPYWVGLLVIDAAYAGLSPHGGGVALAFFAAVQAAYVFSCRLLMTDSVTVAAIGTPNFFLGAGGVMLAIVATFIEVNRRKVFQSMLKIAERDAEIERQRGQNAEALERSKAGRLLGRTLADRYRLVDVLGRGGAGEVYLAEDLAVAGRCAVKVLHSDLAERKDAIRRFLREAENASAVASEHVARISTSGFDHSSGHFIVMEYVEGEDLGALLLRRGLLPFDELRPLIEQIAQVLEATHRAGIVHRDLKPKNVLICTRAGAPFVKLIDFGISKIFSRPEASTTMTAELSILGSAGYMAPEQAIGMSASVGPAADVFSLAAIVYRALTGRLAFSSDGVAAFHQPFTPVHEVNPAIHPDVSLALALALAMDPNQRTRAPLSFVELLSRAVAGGLDDATRQRALRIYRPDAPGDDEKTLDPAIYAPSPGEHERDRAADATAPGAPNVH